MNVGDVEQEVREYCTVLGHARDGAERCARVRAAYMDDKLSGLCSSRWWSRNKGSSWSRRIFLTSLGSMSSWSETSSCRSCSASVSCFFLAVAISAACFFLHFVLRFWNHTCVRRRRSSSQVPLHPPTDCMSSTKPDVVQNVRTIRPRPHNVNDRARPRC